MTQETDKRIRSVDFSGHVHPGLPVEVVEWRALVDRVGRAHFETAQRLSFGLIILVRSGEGRYTVDFESIGLRAGRMVFVRPGQVQQWEMAPDLDAALVVARATQPALGARSGRDLAHRDLGSDSMATASDLVAGLVREQERFEPTEPSVRLMSLLFESLVALFDRAGAPASTAPLPAAYVAFRAAIEAGVGAGIGSGDGGRRTVRDHVAGLGFSERTVDRACRRVTGQSAKVVLDDRIALEARRLLAHTDRPAAKIAVELGFSDPTNFHKFFLRMTGAKPSDFRSELRDAGYEADTPR